MQPIAPLRNPIRHYDWGSTTAIAGLFGRGDADRPEAELWLGAHPSAPSDVSLDGVSWRGLDEVLASRPELLGAAVASRWGALPFLLKVLAAEKPLSIQAHPDLDQARAGFAREEAAGIPRDAHERNFPDAGHKPELIYALTPFTALRGFRPPSEIRTLFGAAGLGALPAVATADDLRVFLSAILSMDEVSARAALDTAASAGLEQSRDPQLARAGRWIDRLRHEYPGDRGALAPLFLHVVRLEPGEALYTGAGILHAYLEGLGIEIMASSDNVLRGALTHKHVDTAELVRVIQPEPSVPRRVEGEMHGPELRFPTPADEFTLGVSDLGDGDVLHAADPGPQILLCTDGIGEVVQRAAGREERRSFGRGDSFLIPADAGEVEVVGRGRVFRAWVRDVSSRNP